MLPPQRRITAQIMRHWGPHATALQEPPSARCLHLRWGALSTEGKKLGRWKANIGVLVSSPRALIFADCVIVLFYAESKLTAKRAHPLYIYIVYWNSYAV